MDQHGEPGRETGGNRVRSACVVSWFSSASLIPSLCLSFSVDVKGLDVHLLNTIDLCLISCLVMSEYISDRQVPTNKN